MQLTRRDAAAALAALGLTGGAALGVREWRERDGPGGRADDELADDEQLRDAYVAVAEVVYPSELSGVPAFVEGVLDGRLRAAADGGGANDSADGAGDGANDAAGGGTDDGEDGGRHASHVEGMRRTVATLDELAEEWHGAPVPELSASTRDRLLREVGADAVDEDPAGTTAERVRYYVVNELLLALYSSETGGELVGIENPQGHPGGQDTYQRGPSRE